MMALPKKWCLRVADFSDCNWGVVMGQDSKHAFPSWPLEPGSF